MADQREIDYDPVTGPQQQQYAAFTWESRWNHNKGASAVISQSGSKIMLTTAMGSVSFDLASPHDDVEAFSRMMLQAIEMLQKTKREYDETMGKVTHGIL